MMVLSLQQTEKRKVGSKNKKKKSHALNVEKKGITRMNVTKNSQMMEKW